MLARFRNLALFGHRFGWLPALEVGVLWVARQVIGYRRALIYRLDLDRIPTLEGCDQFEWNYASPKDVEAEPTSSPSPVEAAGSAAQRAFVGRVNGLQCYSSLVSVEGFRVPDRARILFRGTTDAYVGDCVTPPAHRGQGIYPCGLVQLAHRLRAENRRALYLFVERDNLASIRSIQKAGFQPVAACSVWHLGHAFRRRWRFLTPDGDPSTRHWTVEVPRGPTVRSGQPPPQRY
jgi:RimJ/RimL family protein N-acetyltransferase